MPKAETAPANQTVGEYIWEELEARGWTIAEFAIQLRWPVTEVTKLLDGLLPITEAIATDLATAFGTSTGLWLNLYNMYCLVADKAHCRAVRDWREKNPPLPQFKDHRVEITDGVPSEDYVREGRE